MLYRGNLDYFSDSAQWKFIRIDKATGTLCKRGLRGTLSTLSTKKCLNHLNSLTDSRPECSRNIPKLSRFWDCFFTPMGFTIFVGDCLKSSAPTSASNRSSKSTAPKATLEQCHNLQRPSQHINGLPSVRLPRQHLNSVTIYSAQVITSTVYQSTASMQVSTLKGSQSTGPKSELEWSPISVYY